MAIPIPSRSPRPTRSVPVPLRVPQARSSLPSRSLLPRRAFVATPSNNSVLLSWAAPLSGGSIITGYNIYQGNSPGAESGSPVNGTIFVTSTSAIVTGLDNADTYYFTVKAVNAIGSSLASSEVGLSQPPPWQVSRWASLPLRALMAVPHLYGSLLEQRWLCHLRLCRDALHRLQRPNGHELCFDAHCRDGHRACSGTSYSFTVAAINASGTGAASENSNVVTFAKATTKTVLNLSANKVTYGHEQVENISVTVSPEYPGTVPTGSVTISGTDCHITLAAGKGSCTLSSAKFGSGFFHPSPPTVAARTSAARSRPESQP